MVNPLPIQDRLLQDERLELAEVFLTLVRLADRLDADHRLPDVALHVRRLAEDLDFLVQAR